MGVGDQTVAAEGGYEAAPEEEIGAEEDERSPDEPPPSDAVSQAEEVERDERPEGLRDSLAGLAVGIARLEARADDEHRRAAHREEVIDRLYAENQLLKAGEAGRLLEPVIRDLIRLYDELVRTAGAWRDRSGADATAAAEAFASLGIEVELMLGRQGVDRFTAEPGGRFTRGEHRAVSAVPSDDAALDGTITEVTRSGFRVQERIVRPAEVRIFRRPAESPPASQPVEVKGTSE